MRATPRLIALAGACLFPLACGGSQTQPEAPAAVGNEPTTMATGGQGDLSPAPEPADVVAVARWKNPSAFFGTIQRWFALPVPVDEAVEEIFRVPGAGSVLNLDAPVDFLVALDPQAPDRDPQPFVGFSVGLRSVQDAKQVFERRRALREVHLGVWRVDIGRSGDKLTCFLAPSLGTAAGRIVCGPRQRDVEALYPYMTRGLAAVAPPESDLSGEIRFAPIQARYGKMLPNLFQMGSSFISHEFGTGNRQLDRAITDTVTGVSDETLALVNDLEGLSFRVSLLQDQKNITGDLNLRFKNRKSWVAQRFFDHANSAGAPPAIFWQLPKNSDSAFFQRATDPKHFEGIRKMGGELIAGLLSNEGFAARDTKAVVGLFDKMLTFNADSVTASGHIAIDSPRAGATDDFTMAKAAMTSALGWQLVGLEEKSTRADKWLRDLAATYGRPSVKNWLVKTAAIDRKDLPKVTYRPLRSAQAGAVKALEVSIPASALDIKAKGKRLSVWVLLMPDGGRTWVAWGADRGVLEKQLGKVRGKSPGTGKLGANQNLAHLKTARAVSGGYMNIAGLASQATGGVVAALEGRGRPNREFEEVLNALSKMPNHGETPILFLSTAKEGTPSEFTVRFHVARGTIDDLGSLIGSFAGMRGGPPPPPPRRRP